MTTQSPLGHQREHDEAELDVYSFMTTEPNSERCAR